MFLFGDKDLVNVHNILKMIPLPGVVVYTDTQRIWEVEAGVSGYGHKFKEPVSNKTKQNKLPVLQLYFGENLLKSNLYFVEKQSVL